MLNIMKSRFAGKNLSLLFIAFLLLQLAMYAQTNWNRYAGNPVLDVGLPGTWESWQVNHHDIYLDGDTLKMWYTGATQSPRQGQIGLATSTDGITWDKDTSNPVLTNGDPGAWDSDNVGMPVVIFGDNTYKMWYWGRNSVTEAIGYATSPDGITWTKHVGNPVINTGSTGSWEEVSVVPNSVIFDGSIYKMWYAGIDANFYFRIGYATSSDGINWDKFASNPVLNIGSSGSWDDVLVYTADVLFDGTLYHMWYMGYDLATFRIGYAISSDGINWSKYPYNPILDVGGSGDWDDFSVGHPRVIFDGTTYRMWFIGDDGSNIRIGYAEDFSNLVHADSVIIEETYVIPNTDPLNILGRVISPEGHALTVKAMILSDDGSTQDSVELFDDGLNGDGTAGDGIYGGYWSVTNENEINYTVGIKTVDLVTGFARNGLNWNITDKFTTIGPVVVEDYVITSIDTVPNAGDQIRFKLKLRNNGLTTTAVDIMAVISTTDSCISEISDNSASYGVIAAGQSVIPGNFQQYTVSINPNCLGDSDIWFNVDIYSEDNFFWSDSFAFHIYVTGILDDRASLPDTYELQQNYPNPFNPSTKINYQIPELSFVTLKVYDVLGNEITTLVNREKLAGTYEITWYAEKLSSGIYFYRLQAGSFIETKKMILLR